MLSICTMLFLTETARRCFAVGAASFQKKKRQSSMVSLIHTSGHRWLFPLVQRELGMCFHHSIVVVAVVA